MAAAADQASPRRDRPFRDAGLLIAFSVAAFLVGLGRAPVSRIQELRVLEASREMRASGDYLVPRFGGDLRLQKPPLAYWLALAGYGLTGRADELSGRLYAVFTGVLTVLATFALGRRLGGPRLGLLAGLILAASPLFHRFSRLAETDGLLTLGTTLALGSFWMGFAGRPARRGTWTVLAWTAMGIAFLAKGLAGFFLPLLPVIVFLAAGRRWRDIAAVFHPIGLAAFLAIALPWYIAVSAAHPELIAVFREQIFFAVKGEGHGRGLLEGLYFYPVRILADFAPWCVLLAAAAVLLIRGPRRLRERPDLAFVLAWAAGILLQLLPLGNKQNHYLLPAFPAFALLAAWSLVEPWPLPRAVSPAAMTRCVAAAALLIAAGLGSHAFWGDALKTETKSAREFCRAIRPIVEGAPLYIHGTADMRVDFHLERVLPVVEARPEAIEELFRRHPSFFVIAREIGKDKQGGLDAAIAADPRFRKVRSAVPPEVPFHLYRGEAGGPR